MTEFEKELLNKVSPHDRTPNGNELFLGGVLTEHFNETANQAIMNLNNAAPILGTESSTADMLMGLAGAGLNTWNSMSEVSKAEVKGMFKSTPDDNTLLRNQQTRVGEAAIFD